MKAYEVVAACVEYGSCVRCPKEVERSCMRLQNEYQWKCKKHGCPDDMDKGFINACEDKDF